MSEDELEYTDYMRRSRSSTSLFFYFIIALISTIYYGLYYEKLSSFSKDYGFYLLGGLRVFNGLLPFVDFYPYYSAGRFLLLGGWFKLFGISVQSSQLLFIPLLVLSNLLMFHVACRFLPVAFALVPVFIHLLIPGPWWKIWYMLSVLVGFISILHYIDNPSLLRAFIAGLICSLVIWIRQDVGVNQFVTLVIAVMILDYRKMQCENFLSWMKMIPNILPYRQLLLVILGALLGGTSIILYVLAFGGNPMAFFQQNLWVFDIVEKAGGDSETIYIYPNIVFGSIVMLFLIFFAIITYRKSKSDAQATRLWALLLMAGFCFSHLQLGWFKYYRFPQDQGLFYIVFSLVGLHLYKLAMNKDVSWPWRSTSRLVLVLSVFSIVYYVHYTLIHRIALGGGFPVGKEFILTENERLRNVQVSKKFIRDKYPEVLQVVDSLTAKDAAVFFGANAFLGFIAGRPSPTREDATYFIFCYAERLEEFIGEIIGNPPDLLILSVKDRRIALRCPRDNLTSFIDFIGKHFSYYDRVGRFFLFRRTNSPNVTITVKHLRGLLL